MFNLKENVPVFDVSGQIYFDKKFGEKITEWKQSDILEILLKEKPTLLFYTTISINSVERTIFKLDSTLRTRWMISVSFTNGKMVGGGKEEIENLDLKIRDLKLQHLLYK